MSANLMQTICRTCSASLALEQLTSDGYCVRCQPWVPSLAGIEDPEKAVRELVRVASMISRKLDHPRAPVHMLDADELRAALKPFTTDSEKDGEA